VLVAEEFHGVWAYVLGPVLGAVPAALRYDRFLAQGEQPSADVA